MPYCDDCVDGGNELSRLDENGNIQTSWGECETCKGEGWLDEY